MNDHPKKALVEFDEHGVFELDPTVTETIGGGGPLPPFVRNLVFGDPNGNRLCAGGGNVICRENLACGKNLPCL